ncbi:MAG: lactate utilization protein B [Gammaproteobacteria bacterium]
MRRDPNAFKPNSAEALHDTVLQDALGRARDGFIGKRLKAVEALPEFDALRFKAASTRADAINRLPELLETYEAQVQARGGHVHWAADANEAVAMVLKLCRQAGGGRIAKGKSMVGEEVDLNPALEAALFEVLETDLGEYIIQLAKEPPSHIIAPAVHKTREQVADLFEQFHADMPTRIEDIPGLVAEARRKLRQGFLNADIGITGANLLVAETGSSALVTNEGNGDLSATLPRVHIVVTGIEKVVPDMAAATDVLRVLARSATGQSITSYTSFFTGPRRADDLDGPEEYHVVLVDNGRSRIAAGPYRDMLRCIRCGACINHCPVYGAVGGHAYGTVYPGPMGSVLTPLLQGLEKARDLPHACTMCGRCAEVCPVQIPLPGLLRKLRFDQHRDGLERYRWAMWAWSWLARRPSAWRWALRMKSALLRLIAGRGGSLRVVPFGGDWFTARDQWKGRTR